MPAASLIEAGLYMLPQTKLSFYALIDPLYQIKLLLTLIKFPSFHWEFIRKESFLKNLPLPLFTKEGYSASLWQREVRRDFIINAFRISLSTHRDYVLHKYA
jgi:hypothetical protein